jgi:hypothetical protein
VRYNPIGMARAYDEFVEFISSGPSSAALAAWKASPDTHARVTTLLAGAGILSADDRSELDHYMVVEHLVRLIKGRARERCEAQR